MFIAAIAHRFAFSYKEYRSLPMRPSMEQKAFLTAFIESSVPETVNRTLDIVATGTKDAATTVVGGATSVVQGAVRVVTRDTTPASSVDDTSVAVGGGQGAGGNGGGDDDDDVSTDF